jgi:hypothetical protein
MRWLGLVSGLCLVCSAPWGSAGDKKGGNSKFTCLDLQTKANVRVHGLFAGDDNGVGKLALGEQTFVGVKFNVGEKFIQLAGTQPSQLPIKVEGIKVGQKLAKLHLLHSTGWFTDDGTIIGEYTVTWEDDSSVTIPIRYGKDLLDWWFDDASPEPTEAKVAWKGENPRAQEAGKKVRLYLATWENPKPNLKVLRIDVSSTKETACEPMCLAITAEK